MLDRRCKSTLAIRSEVFSVAYFRPTDLVLCAGDAKSDATENFHVAIAYDPRARIVRMKRYNHIHLGIRGQPQGNLPISVRASKLHMASPYRRCTKKMNLSIRRTPALRQRVRAMCRTLPARLKISRLIRLQHRYRAPRLPQVRMSKL